MLLGSGLLLGGAGMARVGTGNAMSRAVQQINQSQASPTTTAPWQAQVAQVAPTPNVAAEAPVAIPTAYANPNIINPTATQAPPTGLIGAENLLSGGSLLGTKANEFQAAISGLGGAEAQNQAYATLGNSPATRYQMDQMQRSVERSAAARGGLLGGNTLRALQQNAAGIASQDYQNQVNNASIVADRGAGFTGLMANLRNDAGLAIAQNAQTTAANISNLLNQQGIQVSDRLNSQVGTITDLLHSSGMQDSVDANALAQILANIAGGQASNLQQGYQNLGDARAAGILGTNAAIQNATQQAIQLGAF